LGAMPIGAAYENDELWTGAMGPVAEGTGLIDGELVVGCEVGGGYHDECLGKVRVEELKKEEVDDC